MEQNLNPGIRRLSNNPNEVKVEFRKYCRRAQLEVLPTSFMKILCHALRCAQREVKAKVTNKGQEARRELENIAARMRVTGGNLQLPNASVEIRKCPAAV